MGQALIDIPSPGERVHLHNPSHCSPDEDGTVIASVWYAEAGDDGHEHDRYSLVVLRDAPLYFLVTTVRDERPGGGELVIEWAVSHFNLVDAINGTGDGDEEYENGYVHIGGER